MYALIIDDDQNIATTLGYVLEDMGYQILTAHQGQEGIDLFGEKRPEIVLLDLRLPDRSGMEVLENLLAQDIPATVIMITGHATVDTAVEAIKKGAFDYLPKPFTPGQVRHVLEKAAHVRSLEREVRVLRSELKGLVREGDFLTCNKQVREVLARARQVADSSAGVLLSGESGTGKGLLARLIHSWSPRAEGPFVTVDCASLQESLLESELFGHAKGSFTGAVRDKAGKLETADKGSVFLDEIGELPASLQSKLLRFLQSREFERIGETNTRTVDVRVIAATNRDLTSMVKDGSFRGDLFFRVNVVELYMPPLRDRLDDIALLAEHHLERFARKNGRTVTAIAPEAMRLLERYPWPGNVRDLSNAMERAVILAQEATILPQDLPSHVRTWCEAPPENEGRSLSEVERAHIERVVRESASMEEAARILGIDPATLWRKRKRYDLE
jgi:NtrC-family two-component system response regulator AlgB